MAMHCRRGRVYRLTVPRHGKTSLEIPMGDIRWALRCVKELCSAAWGIMSVVSTVAGDAGCRTGKTTKMTVASKET